MDFNQRELVEDFLDIGALAILYGESNAGKTFVALDIAFSIASGRPWHGKKVEQGGALYIAAEGGVGVRGRIMALRTYHGRDDVPLLLVPCSIDLFSSDADTNALIALAKQATAELGVTITLIVIDTLARAIAGGNENTAEDMGVLIGHVDALRAATGAHVLVVHHSGKDSTKGARGSSALRAAADTEIEVVDDEIRTRKQRDKVFAMPIGFRLEPVTIGASADGKPVTSAVAVPRDQPAEMVFPAHPGATAEEKARMALHQCMSTATDAPAGYGLPKRTKVIRERDWTAQAKSLGLSASGEYRARTDLIKSGAVKLKDGWVFWGPNS